MMNRLLVIPYWMCLLVVLFWACSGSEDGTEEDRLLARVGNKSLHISEMAGMFPEGTSGEDSAIVLRNFVTRWTKDAALLNEAERHIPADLNINKLVRDYRASLVTNTYEKILVDQLLDTMVTEEELLAFYEKNKLLYELDKPIVRAYLIKVPTPTPEGNRLRGLWNNGVDSLIALRQYCDKYAEVALLDDSLWYNIDEIMKQLPEGTITASNVGSKRELTQRDDHHQYYFRLFELRTSTQIAPLAYVEEQARKVILHKRKLQLMEEVKQNIYDQQLRQDKIEILYDE